jgi:microcin C transport system permease protein
MQAYIFRRLLLAIPTLFGITLICFGLTRILPGGPVEQMISKIQSAAAQSSKLAESTVNPAEIERLKEYYGMNMGFWEAYGHWIFRAVQGDFGTSWTYGEPVLEVILERMPVSLLFGITSFILSWLICIPLGLWKAYRSGSPGDTISSILLFIGYVLPGYALGIVLILFFAGGTWLDWFPAQGLMSEDFDDLTLPFQFLDILHHMTLPMICYMIGEFTFLTFLIKNSLLDELSKDYIRAIRARGASEIRTLFVHAFRSTLVPLSNRAGEIFTLMFAGSLLIERVFGLSGMGLLFYQGMVNRDYPIVLGIILISSALALVGRLFADLLMVWLDPRIQLDNQK